MFSAVTGLKYSLSPGLAPGKVYIPKSVESPKPAQLYLCTDIALPSEAMTVFHCAAISFLLMSVPRWVTSRPQATLNSASDTPASSIIVFVKSPVEKPTSISSMMTSTDGTQPFVTFASIS